MDWRCVDRWWSTNRKGWEKVGCEKREEGGCGKRGKGDVENAYEILLINRYRLYHFF